MSVRVLTEAQGVALWERVRDLEPARRAAALALAALPEVAPDGILGSTLDGTAMAGLTVGRRNALILASYRLTFGDSVQGYGACPGCPAWVAFGTSCTALLAADRPGPVPTPLERDGYLVFWRVPTTLDLDDDASVSSVVGPDGEWHDPATLPAAIRAVLADKIRECDPLAEITLRLNCPDCGAWWERPLDPPAVFWAELSERCSRLLIDARTLLNAYGWSRAQTLNCPEPRRRALLRVVRGVDPPAWPPLSGPRRPPVQAAYPMVDAVEPRTAVRLGDRLTLRGRHLRGSHVRVRFAHPLIPRPHEILVGDHDDDRELTVTLPSGAEAILDWPAGEWSVSVASLESGGPIGRQSGVDGLVISH